MAESILIITDAAKAHIKRLLAETPKALGLGLSIKTTGCSGLSYVPDLVEKIDPQAKRIEVDGMAIFIDQASLKMIQGTVVDYVTKELGQKQLVFVHPKATGLCGCGESFHLDAEEQQAGGDHA